MQLVSPRTPSTRRFLALGVALATCFGSSLAAAQDFAQPPEGERGPLTTASNHDPGHDHQHDDYPDPDPDFYHPRSTVRLGLGPALRLDGTSHVDGGLFTHLDIGEGPTGVRFSGSWIRSGAERGLAQYGGELWLDFAHESRLHPVVGAGAGMARLALNDPDTGERQAYAFGVGTLRAGLHYLLPVEDTDARATLELIGALPAIRPTSAPELDPWALVFAGVQVGF